MKSSVFIFFIILVSLANAKKHREHGSHVHGQATLAIAMDGLNGQVELKAASDSVLGFEHLAKSAKDKQKLAEVKNDLENKIASYIQFNSSLDCQWSKKSIEMVSENDHGHHSDFVAQFTVTCKKSPVGSSLLIDFTSFKKLKDIDVTILAGDLQLKSEIKSSKVTIDLK